MNSPLSFHASLLAELGHLVTIASKGGAKDLNQLKISSHSGAANWAHAAGTFKKFPKAKKYKGFRKMLDDQIKFRAPRRRMRHTE